MSLWSYGFTQTLENKSSSPSILKHVPSPIDRIEPLQKVRFVLWCKHGGNSEFVRSWGWVWARTFYLAWVWWRQLKHLVEDRLDDFSHAYTKGITSERGKIKGHSYGNLDCLRSSTLRMAAEGMPLYVIAHTNPME
jgi:hypothetical protein